MISAARVNAIEESGNPMVNSDTLPTLNYIKGLKNNLKIAVIQPSHKNHKNVENFNDFFSKK